MLHKSSKFRANMRNRTLPRSRHFFQLSKICPIGQILPTELVKICPKQIVQLEARFRKSPIRYRHLTWRARCPG